MTEERSYADGLRTAAERCRAEALQASDPQAQLLLNHVAFDLEHQAAAAETQRGEEEVSQCDS